MKFSTTVFTFVTLFSFFNNCFGDIDPQAIDAKEKSANALAEASAAEAMKQVRFTTINEKTSAIRGKAMHALTLASDAISTANASLTVTPNVTGPGVKTAVSSVTPETRKKAENAINEAEEAIKKASLVLSTLK